MKPLNLNPLDFPLHGSRLIEASAGTGKTFTIALLYVRLVLGHGGEAAFKDLLTPPQILVVTFTDAATQELRDRIRARLSEAARCFQEPETNIHYGPLVSGGYFKIHHQPYAVSLYSIVQVGFLKIADKCLPVFTDEFWIGNHTITQWPCGSLHNAIFIMQEQVEQFIKPLLIVSNPVHDLCALGFGMFF